MKTAQAKLLFNMGSLGSPVVSPDPLGSTGWIITYSFVSTVPHVITDYTAEKANGGVRVFKTVDAVVNFLYSIGFSQIIFQIR